jgi:hypothetical protein
MEWGGRKLLNVKRGISFLMQVEGKGFLVKMG